MAVLFSLFDFFAGFLFDTVMLGVLAVGYGLESDVA